MLVDLAVMLIDGGECVSDLGALAEQPELFGHVASHSTASRVLHAIGAERARGDPCGQGGGARARRGGWAARPEQIVLDFDATWSRCTPRRRARRRTASTASGFTRWAAGWTSAARRWRACCGPATPGANTAADHIAVLDAALEQLPADVADRDCDEPVQILARADAAGATHAFAAALRERKIRFSLGYYVTEAVGAGGAGAARRARGGRRSTATASHAMARGWPS